MMEPDLQDGDTQKGDSGDAQDGDREGDGDQGVSQGVVVMDVVLDMINTMSQEANVVDNQQPAVDLESVVVENQPDVNQDIMIENKDSEIEIDGKFDVAFLKSMTLGKLHYFEIKI